MIKCWWGVEERSGANDGLCLLPDFAGRYKIDVPTGAT